MSERRRRIEGCLLGTAVGDALGLPFEGLGRAAVQRRLVPHRYALLGRTGFVSDDTEQNALVGQAMERWRTAQFATLDKKVAAKVGDVGAQAGVDTAPKMARTALRNAFEPSRMTRRLRSVRRPRLCRFARRS